MFKRNIAQKIKELSGKFPVIALTGPRQSGKTTLLKSLFPDKNYVSLEDPDIRGYAADDPRGFLNDNLEGVVLDEVQRVPELFSYIQSIVDEYNQPGQFILSGSQNFLLLEKITQSLAGRVALFNLLPLSLSELQQESIVPSSLEDILYQGLYPRIYHQSINPSDWYANYINTYIERDVRLIKNISDISLFQNFLRMCAGYNGQVLNLTSLGNDCGISHNTANAWLSILEASFIVFRIYPYYKNFNKRLIKSPKLYFYDSGLICNLLGIKNKEQLNSHYLRGSIFESFILSEIHKYYLNQGERPDIYFWRDKSKLEIDCIIERHQHTLALEIKSSKTINNNFFSSLKTWGDLSKGSENIKLALVYGGAMSQTRNNIKVFPWSSFLDIFKEIEGIIRDI